MIFRSTVEADLDRLLGCVVDDSISWADPDRLTSFLADGQYRHDRIWVAEQDGEILARAVWWGFATSDKPLALDCVWVHPSVEDPVKLAAELLQTAHEAYGDRPAYHVFLPNDWRARQDTAQAVAWRQEAAERAGLTEELERLRYEWTPESPLPAASERLVFKAEPDDEVFVEAFRRVAEGTLDFETRQALAVTDPDTQAREDVAAYQEMAGERGWWMLAYTPGGDLVGLALPSANNAGPVVGYLGVVPEHRGRGYSDDLLGEITRFLAERGARRIGADTDVTNVPMARSFERIGYRNYSIRLVLSADPANA